MVYLTYCKAKRSKCYCITIISGAAAMPHLTIDPIVAASAVVTSLQHLVSRVTKATEGAVISVSRFNTGKALALSKLCRSLRHRQKH